MRLDWTPAGGTSIRLDQDPRWRLLRLSGHGLPATRLETTGTPGRGERVALDAAPEPRILTLAIHIHGSDITAYEANRSALAASFAPWRDAGAAAAAGVLTVTLADGRIRAVRAFPRHGLAWSLGRQRGTGAVETLVLEAADPFWYDPVAVSGSATIRAPGNLRFNQTTELGFPAGFGSDLPSANFSVTNAGSVRSFPIISLPGPVTNPTLRHGADGRFVGFTLIVPLGLTLEVTLGAQPDGAADAPTAVLIDDLGGRTGVLHALRTGSRFWALGPGDNPLLVTQDAPESGGSITYRYFQRDSAI